MVMLVLGVSWRTTKVIIQTFKCHVFIFQIWACHLYSFFSAECRTFDGSCFEGEQIDLDNIPQYIREYERGKDVELWKITYCSKKLGRRLHSSYDVITGEISAL